MTRFFKWNGKIEAKEISCIFLMTALLFLIGLLLACLGSTSNDEDHEHAFAGGITIISITSIMFLVSCAFLLHGISCNNSKGEKRILINSESKDEKQNSSNKNYYTMEA